MNRSQSFLVTITVLTELLAIAFQMLSTHKHDNGLHDTAMFLMLTVVANYCFLNYLKKISSFTPIHVLFGFAKSKVSMKERAASTAALSHEIYFVILL